MGKKVMFVFILEVLDGDGPKSGSFWEVPKKRHHRPTLPKKPKEKPVASPLASEALVESLLTLTLPAVPEPCGHEMMTGVEPSAPNELPPPIPSTRPPPLHSTFLGSPFTIIFIFPDHLTCVDTWWLLSTPH